MIYTIIFFTNILYFYIFNVKLFFITNVIFYPLLIILCSIFISNRNQKSFSLFHTVLIFFNINLILQFINFENCSIQFYVNLQFSKIFNFSYCIGLDILSLVFIQLTSFLFIICILSNQYSIRSVKKKKLFFFLLFLIEFFCFQFFVSFDLVFFYFFYEAIIIPMIILIIFYGNRVQKIYAAYLFFYYALIGSFFMFFSILYIYNRVGSTNQFVLQNFEFNKFDQYILFITFFIAFATKLPLYPFHLQLPEAHVEAPTTGSIILAGILLKMGGYGLIRQVIPFFPLGIAKFSNFIYVICAISIIYSSFAALFQVDMKKIIAYSSISHMGLSTIGIFLQNAEGLGSSIFSMFTHGIISAGLFFCVGVIYDRYSSRLVLYYGGLNIFMPIFDYCFFIFCLANIAFPGTCGFSSEFILLLSIYNKSFILLLIIIFGVYIIGVYIIQMYCKIMFGPVNKNFIKYIYDMNIREFFISSFLIFFIVYFGVYVSVYTYLLKQAMLYLSFT